MVGKREGGRELGREREGGRKGAREGGREREGGYCTLYLNVYFLCC